MKKILLLLAVIIAAYLVFRPKKRFEPVVIPIGAVEKETLNQNFTCSGKIHCSQMISCDEAMFYLKNCPGVKIDGDGDGQPCEDRLCGK